MEWINLIVFAGLAIVTGVGILVISSVVGPKKPKDEKLDTYECGVPLLSSSRERFSVHFYLVAIIFMLFDIEVAYLIPWAVVYKSLGIAGLIEMLIFILVLGFGLYYVYKKGVLEWE